MKGMGGEPLGGLGAGGASRRAVLCGLAGMALGATCGRRAFADDPVAETKDLKDVFALGRPLPRGAKEAVVLLTAALKANAGVRDRVREALESDQAGVRDIHMWLAMAWNDVLTLAHYHGVHTKEDYGAFVTSVAHTMIRCEFPISPRWSIKFPATGAEQLSATIEQQHLGLAAARTIRAWNYRWDTVYSGIGGENAKKLAEISLQSDRDSMMTTKREVSRQVQIKRFNRAYPRSYFYTVRGADPEFEGDVRRSNWYVKGTRYTVNIELIERLDPGSDEDGLTEWHRVGPCPEVAFVLGSMAPAED